jgi:hypothetical protein
MGVGVYVLACAVGLRGAGFLDVALALAAGFRAAVFFAEARFFMARNLQ